MASGPFAGGPTAVWPLLAVGGCLAIATLGVIGLQTDLGRPGSLQAGTVATAAVTPTTFRTAAASPSADDAIATTIDQTSAVADANALAALVTTVGPTTSLDQAADAGPTSPPGPIAPFGTQSSGLLETPAIGEVAEIPVYGVYDAPFQETGQLGSFTMIGDDPVTSSSSLDGRTTVWLRVETSWVEATVVAEDPLTDVALLAIVDDGPDLALPAITLASEPIQLGAPAMVGYGDPDFVVEPGNDPENSAPNGWGDRTEPSPSVPSGKPTDDPSGNWGGESGDDSGDTSADDAGDTSGDDADRTSPTADDGGRAEIETWMQASDRRGVIYSLTKPS